VFGDFNEDFNINKQGVLLNGLRSLELIPTIESVKTHDKGKQLDWVFTNRRREKQNSQIYPVWYSDHAAIRTELELWNGIDLILRNFIYFLSLNYFST
jgi:endonuclease/exonuclease/phosphatase family metal-dependent hydrolase